MASLRAQILGGLVSSVIVALLAGACSGGGGGGGSSGAGTAAGSTDFLVTDATVDELLAFHVSLASLELVSVNGNHTANVLAGEAGIDLIGASASPRWITRGELPEGTFRGVAVTLVPGSSSAIDRGGAAVAVNELATSFEVLFAGAVTIDSNGYRQIMLDIDLVDSLSGSVTAPPLEFTPTGSAQVVSSSAPATSIDEVKGTLLSFAPAAERLVIDAFADGDQTLPLGHVRVDLTGTTMLLDDDGSMFANHGEFWSALAIGSTMLEVHGSLQAGRVVATRIEVEDDGVHGPAYVVKLDGIVSNLDPALDSFTLEILEIEKGASIAAPVLGGASSITVGYDASTRFVLEEHMQAAESDLANGQRVKVKFPAFVGAPFRASQIEIEQQPEFEGLITDVSGLPSSITMRLSPDEPAVQSGQVAGGNTPVTVDLTASTLFLDTHARPALALNQLQAGLKLEVKGSLSGPASGPTIAATATKIHAGRFKGTATAVFPSAHSFDAAMTSLDDSFGASVSFGSVAVDFDPSCAFLDEAESESQFFALFNGLGAGDELEVVVFGVGTGTPDEVRAYEVKARVH